MDDPYDLERFVEAQAGVIDTALAELSAGKKQGHWMWFVFPQLEALGRSPTARRFGITSLDEAKAYLAHPILGPRLVAATKAVLSVTGRSLNAIFGSPDDLKFRSAMTLFIAASAEPHEPFAAALSRYCDDRPDPATHALLDADPQGG